MVKTIILIIFAIGVGYIAGSQKWNNTLKQERLLIYRQECQNEWDEIGEVVDNFVKNTPNITTEQTKNVAIRAGIADKNGYIIDDDIWVKDCIDEKIVIFE